MVHIHVRTCWYECGMYRSADTIRLLSLRESWWSLCCVCLCVCLDGVSVSVWVCPCVCVCVCVCVSTLCPHEYPPLGPQDQGVSSGSRSLCRHTTTGPQPNPVHHRGVCVCVYIHVCLYLYLYLYACCCPCVCGWCTFVCVCVCVYVQRTVFCLCPQ